MYADYTYYITIFGGRAIPEKEFNLAAEMATRYIDRFTYGRINEANKDSIKGLCDCMCDMAEAVYKALYAKDTAADKGIKSERRRIQRQLYRGAKGRREQKERLRALFVLYR